MRLQLPYPRKLRVTVRRIAMKLPAVMKSMMASPIAAAANGGVGVIPMSVRLLLHTDRAQSIMMSAHRNTAALTLPTMV